MDQTIVEYHSFWSYHLLDGWAHQGVQRVGPAMVVFFQVSFRVAWWIGN